jgi:uncharacterized protein
MKTTLLATLAILSVQLTSAQQAAEPPLVSTTGTAEIKVVPDLADLYFEVEVRNADLGTARKQQAERTAKVLAALRASGIEEKDLQAADISIAPNYTENRRDSAETARVRFFSVSQGISIKLRDVKQVPDTIATAVAAGVTEVRNVALGTSELRKHRDAARANAIKAAKEKAIALAGELGAKVGRPYRITEGSDPWRGYGSISNNVQVQANAIDDVLFGTGGSATFAPGTISISANVSVSFVIE